MQINYSNFQFWRERIYIFIWKAEWQQEITHILAHPINCCLSLAWATCNSELHPLLPYVWGAQAVGWVAFQYLPWPISRKLQEKQSSQDSNHYSNKRCQCCKQWLNLLYHIPHNLQSDQILAQVDMMKPALMKLIHLQLSFISDKFCFSFAIQYFPSPENSQFHKISKHKNNWKKY